MLLEGMIIQSNNKKMLNVNENNSEMSEASH